MLKSPWARFQAILPNSAQAKGTGDLQEPPQFNPSADPGVTGAPTAHSDTGITPNSSEHSWSVRVPLTSIIPCPVVPLEVNYTEH